MSRSIVLLARILSIGGTFSVASTAPSLPASCEQVNDSLFCEDWSSGRIRNDVWEHAVTANGGGNGEFQLYSQHPQNSFVANGTLHLRPTFTYNTFGDLRSDLDLKALGCTSNWNQGCHKPGTLHASSPSGKLWASQLMSHGEMAHTSAAIASAGLPACDLTADGLCNHMVPVGGLRATPIMSAKLSSRFSFKYGRVEVTATLPRGHSLWPAIWMLPTGQGPWPTGGEIDIVESMGSAPEEGFALDHRSTSSAIHVGEKTSWYDLAYTPSYEKLRGMSFGSLAGRRALKEGGEHTFGLYWARDNLYTYVDDDANRVLDMDAMFRLNAKEVLNGLSSQSPVWGWLTAEKTRERRELAEKVASEGYMAGWRAYLLMMGKEVPAWLGADGSDAPFDRPFQLIMNLAVGGDFFKGNLNPESEGKALFDVPITLSGQLPAMYWYSRMKTWWASWAQAPSATSTSPAARLHKDFLETAEAETAFLQTRNTWTEYADGGQDTGQQSRHKADRLADVPPPADDEIGNHVDLKIRRVVVWPVEGSEVESQTASSRSV